MLSQANIDELREKLKCKTDLHDYMTISRKFCIHSTSKRCTML